MTSDERCYQDVDSMWIAMLEELWRSPTNVEARAGSGAMSHEVIGTSWTLLDPRRNFLVNSTRAADPSYASAELLWYLSRDDNVEMLLPYAPSYKRFAEADGRAHGAYGRRVAMNAQDIDQLDYVMQRLRQDPHTRQCIVALWRSSDLVMKNKRDIPCTICWQFLLRENNLHMITYMRSNDAWLGVPYDVYCFSCIQQMMAASLGVGIGKYVHKVGSLHLYARDARDALVALHSPWDQTPSHEWPACKIEHSSIAVRLERWYRTGRADMMELAGKTLSGCLSDSVSCCARKLGRAGAGVVVTSPALNQGFHNVHHRRSRLGGKNNARENAGEEAQ